MTVKELKTAVANIDAFLSMSCDDETVTFSLNVIKSIKDNYEELIEYKENEATSKDNQWKSVEDELPAEKIVIDGETGYRIVLVWTDKENLLQAFYDDELKQWGIPGEPFALEEKVTHWMPIPTLKPPKEGAANG